MDLWDSILESDTKLVLEADDDKEDKKDSDTKADEDDSKKAKEEEKTDTDDEADDTEDAPPDTDNSDEEEPPATDDAEDTPPEDDGGESDTPPENGGEPGDEGEGGEVTPDGGESPDASPAQDSGKNSKVNTIVLLDNFISLYKMIDNTIKKISESRKDNILASVTFNQVRANLSRLAGVVYKYITLYYDGNDHALNLYNFKYFMEILKLNLEMIRKVTSTNKETETSI